MAALSISGTGCAALQRMALDDLEVPAVARTSIGVEGQDLDGVTLLVRLRVGNPNPEALALRTLSSKLAVQDGRIFQGVLPGALQLGAKAPHPSSVRCGYDGSTCPGSGELPCRSRRWAAG